MIPPPAQRQMAARAGSTVAEAAGSHAIYVSKPEAVAALIAKAAKSVSSKNSGVTAKLTRSKFAAGLHAGPAAFVCLKKRSNFRFGSLAESPHSVVMSSRPLAPPTIRSIIGTTAHTAPAIRHAENAE